MRILIVTIAALLGHCHGLIVPQEVPSLLSLIYSTIPQVKKGTDSRFGFGFRLGEHADFQVMFELGPQTETRPIGEMASSQNNKRNVDPQDFDNIVKKSPNKEGTSWLMNWSNDMSSKKIRGTPPTPETGSVKKGMNPKLQTVPLISESALKQLQLLYKKPGSSEGGGDTAAMTFSQEGSSSDGGSQGMEIEINPRRKKPARTKDQITAELMDVDLE